jgi:chromosome segregation ATPase
MKSRVAIIILVLVCAGLGIGLFVRNNNAVEEKKTDDAKILQLSNDVVTTRSKLEEQQTVNLNLETNLSQRKSELETTSNSLAQTAASLAKAQADAKAAAEAAAAEMAKRDAKIAELQGQNDDMTKKMTDLNSSIVTLEKQIGDTERKLASSEGDRAFLLKELVRLQKEKAELERQFNDLAVLREQVRKLKDELSIARRLEWIRQGIYGRQNQKGGEALMNLSGPQPRAATNTDLKVDLKQTPRTNAPPEK